MRLPVTFPLRPSRTLAVSLALAHVAAIALLWSLQLPITVKLLLVIATVCSAADLFWRLTLRRRRSIMALKLGSDGHLDVMRSGGTLERARIEGQSTVLPGLVVLRLRNPEGREMLLLPVDALGATAHRHLRLWLRWNAKLK